MRRWSPAIPTAVLAAMLASGSAASVDVGGRAERSEHIVDYERSTIVAVLHKAGLLRFLGHEHGILVRDWSARVDYDEAAPERMTVSLEVRVGTLVIDSTEARRHADVDPDGPDDEEVEEIQQKMMGGELLDAARFPTITFRSERVQRRGDGELWLRGPLTLRGVTRQVEVPVTVTPEAGGLRATGELEIKQRDYGIEPVSIAGVIKVADQLDIRFDVFLLPALFR